MKIKTNISKLIGPAPLYCQSGYELEPFPAYLQIDPVQRLVTFGVDGDPCSMAENMYYGRVYRADMPNNLTFTRISEIYINLWPKIKKIMAGYRETVNQKGDRIGRLSKQALAILAELRDELASMDASGGPDIYVDANVYLDTFDYVQADTADDTLQQIAEKIAEDSNIVFADGSIFEDILVALTNKRAELREAVKE
jgi:hypothetical protein